MFFEKKKKKERKCENCGSASNKRYSFCPECGNSFLGNKEKKDFGMLGKNDFSENDLPETINQGSTITDKLINSIMNSMMKNLDKQFKDQFKDLEKGLESADVKSFPNGIKIKISGPFGATTSQNAPKEKKTLKPRQVDNTQAKKMTSLPREKAKTSVKRLGDKIIYELATPGVNSTNDIFISKLESGYEIKALGDKKIYVNNIPLNLPLRKYSIIKNKLSVEFLSQEEIAGF